MSNCVKRRRDELWFLLNMNSKCYEFMILSVVTIIVVAAVMTIVICGISPKIRNAN